MKLKCVPNPYGYLQPARATAIDEFFAASFKEFPEVLENLFSKPEVIEAIKNNDFVKVFDICREVTYHSSEQGEEGKGCNPLLLCHFFYLLDVDFIEYLPYEYVKQNILHGEWKEKDKQKDYWGDATYFEKVDD